MPRKSQSKSPKPEMSPKTFPVATEVVKHESPISSAGAKYQYPLELAAQTARRNPREENKVLAGAMAELSMMPDLAAESYYSIPRKKWDKEKGTFEIVKIEGPSIGAAMTLARRWGNAINGSHVREELDDRVVCEGVFIDAETNCWTLRTITAEKFYTDKMTKLKRPLPQDMLINAIQAAQSKAVRNAILSGLPKWLTRAYFAEAKRLASGGKAVGAKAPAMSLSECMDWLRKNFNSAGVTPEMLDKYIEENLGDMTPAERIGELRGIYNSIKDGVAKVDEIFTFPPAPKKPGTPSGPVTAGALMPGQN